MDKDFKCWEARKCTPSHYLLCPAFALNKNCWEVPGTRYQESHGQSNCRNCEVYLLHNVEICLVGAR
jgi:hypothetical protein